jgi:hypothetical protein
MTRCFQALAGFGCLIAVIPALAQSVLAPTPPMGWNSWDSYGLSITEPQFRTNVSWFKKVLYPRGWQYVVIDEGWYLLNPLSEGKPTWQYALDSYGRFIPAPNRFPSAADGQGFKSLADYVHSLGLKFGIHIIRGIPREAVTRNLPIQGAAYRAADAADQSDTCGWNRDNYGVKDNAAGQAYYDSILRAYASWGVDFLKVDCISSPFKADEIRMVSLAIERCGRPIVLSLSPGPTPLKEAADVKKYAQMWRISPDLWDSWEPEQSLDGTQGLLSSFKLLAEWAPYREPGHWPDADMLPLGYLGPHTRGAKGPRPTMLTHDEQRTLMSLWSIARSPLMMGGNLPRSDRWTTALLTNPEVLEVDQGSRNGREVLRTPETSVWLADGAHQGEFYLAVFNTGATTETIQYPWKDLNLSGSRYMLRDLWGRHDLGAAASLKIALRPHASVLYRLRAKK